MRSFEKDRITLVIFLALFYRGVTLAVFWGGLDCGKKYWSIRENPRRHRENMQTLHRKCYSYSIAGPYKFYFRI